VNCPPQIQYGNTHGVCEDSQGFIYVHHTVHKDSPSDDAMVRFRLRWEKFVYKAGVQSSRAAHMVSTSTQKVEKTFFLISATKIAGAGSEDDHQGATRCGTIGYPEQSEGYQPHREMDRGRSTARPI